jgi:hypothetical protein
MKILVRLLSTIKQLLRDRNWQCSGALQEASLNLYLIVLSAFALDLFGFGDYTAPLGKQQEPKPFLNLFRD